MQKTAPGRTSSSRREYAWAILCLLAGTALFFRGPLFLKRLFHIPYDLDGYHHPLSEFIAWSLRTYHRLPYWNPFSYCGEPFFGNVQAAMFYPPTLIAALAGNALFGGVTLWTMELQLIAHVAIAGIGAYVLMRVLRASHVAALAAAIVFSFGSFFASQTQHLGAISAAAWVPWFVAALHRLEERRNWPSAALAAFPLGMMIMPGFPALYLPVFAFGPLLYGYWMWNRQPRLEWRAHARAVLLLLCAVSLALLLAAVSWLPAYQVGKVSVATDRPAGPALEGLIPEAATSFFWPNLFNQLRGELWRSENPTFLYLYHGIAAVLILLAALNWLAGMRRARPFLVAGGVALIWMFGTSFFVSETFYLIFPRFVRRGLYPAFVMAYFSLFFAVLVGMALNGYLEGDRRRLFSPRNAWRAAAATGTVALITCAASAFSTPSIAARTTASGASLLGVAVCLGAFAVVLGGHLSPARSVRTHICAWICALLFVDLLAVGSHTRLNTYDDEEGGVPQAVEQLREKLGPLPIYRIDTSGLPGDWQTRTMQWRLPSANGMNPQLLRDVVTYRAPFSSVAGREFTLQSADSPLLDLAGIRYVATSQGQLPGLNLVQDGYPRIFENPRAFPRFFLVGAAAPCRDIRDAAEMIDSRQVDPARVAVVLAADLPALASVGPAATSQEIGGVDVLAYTPNEIRLRVRASRPAILVASETFWPDWQATVDGVDQRIVRADGLFRGIRVDAGAHEVRMYIAPRMLYAGAALSGLGLLLAVCCLSLPWARHLYDRRRHRHVTV